MKKDMMFQELNKKEKNNKRSNTMRRSIYLFALLTLFVIGCSEESSVLAPVNNVNTNEPNWIALPKAEGMQVNNTFTTFKLIDGLRGGTISDVESYSGGPFGTVTMNASIQFPKGAFTTKVSITMSNDDASTVTTFGPSMVFLKYAIFNITYTGLDLSNSNSNINFVYLAPDGTIQPAVNDGIVVSKTTGTLQVKNARIPHFSRYGFVN